MWGLADKFRREVPYHRPDWQPNLDEYLASNPLLNELVTNLFNGTYAREESRDGVRFSTAGQDKFGKDLPGTIAGMDTRLWDYMKKNKRAWPTWVTVNGKPYAIPLFYPTAWYSLNVWRSLGENGKKAADAPSVWERMWEGQKLSEIDFGKYSEHFSDWKNVNGAQLARTLVLLFLSHKFARISSGAYETYMTKIFDGKTFTDWEKRWRLGGRGEDVVAGILGLLTYSAFTMKVMMDKEGVGALGNPETTESDAATLEEAMDNSIATIILNAMYQPETKGTAKTGLKNIRGALAMMSQFFADVQLDWAMKSVNQTADDHRQTKMHSKKHSHRIIKANRPKF
jgi:hypothetical protein